MTTMMKPVPATAPAGGEAGRLLRTALSCYPTGVTVVTTRAADGRPVGLTVNSFASLSMDPPLLLWSLSNRSPSLRAFKAAGHFVINVLASTQEGVAQRFADRTVADKFEGVGLLSPATLAAHESEIPVLDGAVAWYLCACRDAITIGDHTLFVGHVEAHDSAAGRQPLVFLQGRFTGAQ